MTQVHIIKPNVVNSPTPRNHIAEESVRSQQYNDLYDYFTVCYDVYWTADGDAVELICPPLVNFADEVKIGKNGNKIDGTDSSLIKCVSMPRSCKITVDKQLLDDQGNLCFLFKDGSEQRVEPNVHLTRLTAGRNVLHAIQKNNALNWIADWVKFYTTMHGVDTFVIYDNNTDAYSRKELSETIVSNFENDSDGVVIIYEWDVPFGPALQPFVSFFCQPSALEHGRFAVYPDANFVINVDIDEYILYSGKNIAESLDACKPGEYIYVPGYWVENIKLKSAEAVEEPRAWMYGYCDPYRYNLGKFFYRPSNSVNVDDTSMSEHHINGMKPVYDQSFRVAHFAALTLGWLTGARAKRKEILDVGFQHWVDPLLMDNFSKVFKDEYLPDKSEFYLHSYKNAIEVRSQSFEYPIIHFAKGFIAGKLDAHQWKNIFIYKKKTLVFEKDVRISGQDRTVAFDLKFDNWMRGEFSLSIMVRGDSEGKILFEILDNIGLTFIQDGHSANILKEKLNATVDEELQQWVEKCSSYMKFILDCIECG